MRKSTYILLNIFSLGAFYLYVKIQAKKLENKVNHHLTYSQQYNFDINDLCLDLGGKENISQINSTLSSVNIELRDMKLVNHNLKTKYKIRGVSKTSERLVLLFGDNAKQIANDLKKILA